ncbi:zinc-ribbon domain-containing protein [Paenibacillus agaridevorans]|uniref:zinc-ribbon domain-containing protein n=1 Tax=Paenibacillus agaridevorans TaxID=171404 RepID=UPI001BE4AEDF|nr:zinc ribbon domain-containing protein [Paenibacillus agaridevorans]
MSYCNKCGHEVPNGSAYCSKCGNELPKELQENSIEEKKPNIAVNAGNDNPNSTTNKDAKQGLFGCLGCLGFILLFAIIIGSCGASNNNVVPNDWDFDGDTFDKGDMREFFKYKESQSND